MVNCLHRKVKGHELANGLEAGHGGTDGHTRKAHLGNGRVDHALVAVLFPQALADLVRSVVLCDFLQCAKRVINDAPPLVSALFLIPLNRHYLAKNHHRWITRHLLVQGLVERVAHRQSLALCGAVYKWGSRIVQRSVSQFHRPAGSGSSLPGLPVRQWPEHGEQWWPLRPSRRLF